MAKMIKAIYDSQKTVENVLFDLIGTGIPHDNINQDKEKNSLEVMTAKETEPEIRKILERHNPEKLN